MEQEGTPLWLKIVIGLGAVSIMGLIAAGIGIYLLVQWGEEQVAGMVDAAPALMEEGAAFGAGATDSACLDEGLKRAEQCSVTGMRCQMEAVAFGSGCLEASPYDPATCAGVADGGDLNAWVTQQCVARNMAEVAQCPLFLGALVPPYCEQHKPTP